jgi:hypothetical protein
MSFDTHRTWFYETVGRNIHLWQWVDTAATDTVGSYRVKLPADYVKAMVSDMKGDVERKEYYMREFWKKVADNESNKRIISVSFPTSPFAVR